MPKTFSEIMYDMVKIPTIAFEMVCCLKYPGSDRVKETIKHYQQTY